MKEIIVGSSPRCDINISNDFVSSYHCRLLYSSDGIWIEDLDSRNGTYINGHQIRPGTQFRLKPSSEVVLAKNVQLTWDTICKFQPNQKPRLISNQTKALALKTFNLLNYNPVSNLSKTYNSLNRSQAIEVGVVFASVSALLSTIGSYFFIEGTIMGSFYDFSPSDILILLLSFLIFFGSLSMSHYFIRRIFGNVYHFDVDVFVAGVCSLPVGAAMIASGIVGILNIQLVFILLFFSFCYIMMIIHSSLVHVSNVPQKVAIPSVPAIALGGAYISKVFLFSFIF